MLNYLLEQDKESIQPCQQLFEAVFRHTGVLNANVMLTFAN